jgi:hypothetical protein
MMIVSIAVSKTFMKKLEMENAKMNVHCTHANKRS